MKHIFVIFLCLSSIKIFAQTSVQKELNERKISKSLSLCKGENAVSEIKKSGQFRSTFKVNVDSYWKSYLSGLELASTSSFIVTEPIAEPSEIEMEVRCESVTKSWSGDLRPLDDTPPVANQNFRESIKCLKPSRVSFRFSDRKHRDLICAVDLCGFELDFYNSDKVENSELGATASCRDKENKEIFLDRVIQKVTYDFEKSIQTVSVGSVYASKPGGQRISGPLNPSVKREPRVVRGVNSAVESATFAGAKQDFEEFKKELSVKIEQAEKKIQEVKAQTKEKGSVAQEKVLKDLEEAKENLKKQQAELKYEGESSWKKLKAGISEAADKLNTQIQKALK